MLLLFQGRSRLRDTVAHVAAPGAIHAASNRFEPCGFQIDVGMMHRSDSVPQPSRTHPPTIAWRPNLLLLAAFGFGAAIGYAAGAQRSPWGLLGLVLLLLGLAAAEAWRRQRARAEPPADSTDAQGDRPAVKPGRSSRDLTQDHQGDKQRYLM
jgi:hypothetical protein